MLRSLTLRSLHVTSTHMRVPASSVNLLAALLVPVSVASLGGCSKPTSDRFQLWKTTEKGPERLHDALASHSVPPKLRAEAAIAMVDIGRAEEVDTIITGLPADDRAEIAKTLLPGYEAAMTAQGPAGAMSTATLAYRDALFSLRQSVPAEDKQRIDSILLAALDADYKAGKPRQGRHSLDKMLTAIGADGSAMLVRVLLMDGPYTQAADMLAKVGDDADREKGAAALIARAPRIKAS